MATSKKRPLLGPRGGQTTVSPTTGLMKKAMYLYHDEWEQLRRHSYEENRPASDIVREALRLYFEARTAAKKRPSSSAAAAAAAAGGGETPKS
jgi:hypothetical protein